MNFPLLQEMDLNLLVVLDVLLRKRGVVAAARELGCGQPSVSKKLAVLRRLLDDPLLVRQGRCMRLTPRGEELAEVLPQRLAELQACLKPKKDFIPASATGIFRIGLQYYPPYLAASLMHLVQERAPGLDLHFLERSPDEAQEQLSTGSIELLVHVADKRHVYGVQRGSQKGYGRYREHLYIQELYDEEFVTIAHREHPALDGPLELDMYTELPHVLYSAQGDAFGFVDAALQEQGRTRRIGALVQDWTLGCEIVVRAGYLMTLNHDLALEFMRRYPITLYRTPLQLPRSHLSQLWHTRNHEDPLHRWMRECLREVGEELQQELNASLLIA